MTVCTSVFVFCAFLCEREYDYAGERGGERASEKTSAQRACSGADDLYHTFVKISLVCLGDSERKYNKGT